MELHDLEKMTVIKLREEAHKHEVEGASGKSKDELIDILCGKLGIERKHGLRRGIGRRALKEKVRSLKSEREKVIEAGDPGAARIQRRRLKATRRRLRKVIKAAKISDARAEAAKKAAGAAAETPAS